MSTTIDLIEGPAAFVDRDGLVRTANSALASALGLSRRQLVGQPVLHFLAHDLSRRVWQQMQDGGSDGARKELLLETDDRSLPVVCKPMQDDTGLEGYLLQRADFSSLSDPMLQFFREDLEMGIWDYDVATGEIQVSRSWRTLRGLGPEVQLDEQNRNWLDDVHPDDRAPLSETMERQNRGEVETINIQYRVRHTDGHWVWILCRGRIIEYDENRVPKRIVGSDIDISEMKHTHDEVEQLASKLQMAMEASQIGVWEYDSVTNQTFWDDRTKVIYGIEAGSDQFLTPGYWEAHLHPDDKEEAIARITSATEAGTDFQHEYRIVRPDGTIRHIRSRSRQIMQDDDGFKLIGVNVDITEQYEREQALEQARAQLEYEATHDVLTGLANRRPLDEMFDHLHGKTDSPVSYAIMTLDVDHLKRVNDTFGHAAGDAVLRVFSQRLRAMVPDDALVARTGGDEFVALFPQAPPLAELETMAATIVNDMQQPIIYEGIPCRIGVSIGIALAEERFTTPSQTFINADLALYEAKKGGRSGYRVFSANLRLDSDLRLA